MPWASPSGEELLLLLLLLCTIAASDACCSNFWGSACSTAALASQNECSLSHTVAVVFRGLGGPHDSGTYNSSAWDIGFFVSDGGNWESEYGRFFLSW